MSTSASRLAALAGVPAVSRHVRGNFGPATLRLIGTRAVLELDDGSAPPLRLTWTDTPGRAVGPRVADLLRTTGTAVLERPDQLRIPGRRKITDPPSSTPDTPRSVTTTALDSGIRLEVAPQLEGGSRPPSASEDATGRDPDPARPAQPGARAVVLSATQAHDLADLLDAWAELPVT